MGFSPIFNNICYCCLPIHAFHAIAEMVFVQLFLHVAYGIDPFVSSSPNLNASAWQTEDEQTDRQTNVIYYPGRGTTIFVFDCAISDPLKKNFPQPPETPNPEQISFADHIKRGIEPTRRRTYAVKNPDADFFAGLLQKTTENQKSPEKSIP